MNTFNLLNEKENNLPVSPNKIPSMIMGCIALQITGNGHPVANADLIDFVPVKIMVILIATENFSNPRL